MVYLIGAGPGDSGLITLKGYTYLLQADCIIYDRLTNPDLLKNVKENCECIYVGKENHHHTLSQDKIIDLLIEKAKQYKMVVRLKGGDNYVFGRGGEEGLALYQEKIPFEVIPGIPSFIGAPAYAGIPITHRGIATGIHILTAHGKNDEPLDIDFSSIKDNETTIFMMGLSKLEEIVTNLLKYKNSNFPIALISNGTNENQSVLISTIGNVLEDILRQPMVSPCLIIVGNVIQYHKQLDFISRKPSIAFPRVSSDTSYLKESLEYKGYQVNEYFVSNLKPISHSLKYVELKNYTHIIFSSKFGVQCFMNALKEEKIDIRNISHLKFCVIGQSTGKELEKYGIYYDYCPEYYTSEELCKLLLNQVESASILICKVFGEVTKWDCLKTKFKVNLIDLYENIPTKDVFKIKENAIVFTCSSAVIQTLSKVKLSNTCKIFSIGPKTSETIKNFGYNNVIESKQADFTSLSECIERNLKICIEQED